MILLGTFVNTTTVLLGSTAGLLLLKLMNFLPAMFLPMLLCQLPFLYII